MNLLGRIFSLSTILILTACGVGGSSSSSTPTTTIGGSAATGLAMQGATVTAICSNGITGTGTTASDGSFSIDLTGGVKPCILKATDPNTNQSYYSVSTPDSSVANVSPLTHLIAANVFGADPSTQFTSTAATGVTSNNLTNSVSAVKTALTGLGVDLTNINPIASSFSPALPDSGVSIDTQDAKIDQLMSAMNSAKVSLTATTGTTLLTAMYSGDKSATAAANAVSSLVTNQTNAGNIIPTSSYSGCPYAHSGQYITFNFGDRTALGFSVITVNFGSSPLVVPRGGSSVSVPANTILKGDGTTTMTIASSTNSATCRFAAKVNGATMMEFSVSPAGFIVGSPTEFPSANTAQTVTAMSSTKLGLGIPVQSQISLDDATGTWNTAEWNLPNGDGSHPFTNAFSKVVASAPNGNSSAATLSQCDGGMTCSSQTQNITISKCTNCTDSGGTPINNIFNVTDGANLNLKAALFKAPNNDLIGIISGSSCPANVTSCQGGSYLISGIVLRSSATSSLPPNGKTVTNPQWKLSYNNNTLSLTETAQVYTTSNATAANGATPASLVMSYTDTANSGNTQTVKMDTPRQGMIRRDSTGNTNITTPMVGLRGNGWSIAGGTTLMSDYPNVTNGTGRFFSINIKY
jgi:hypothetical protein